MQILQIGIGLAIIIYTFLDFFHSTMSGNGFGWLSGNLNRVLNRLLIRNQSRAIFNYSGLLHLLITTFVWLGLLFLGTYIIFTSGKHMVVDSEFHLAASYVERFYYTGFVLSTLGVGDFVPGNPTADILTSLLSFSGFVLITTGLTYLVSVVNAVLDKKQLSFFIATIGSDVEEIYEYYKQQDDLTRLLSDSNDLREQILKNSSNYLAFPMVNYFLTRDRHSSLAIQVTVLYEVLNILKLDWEEGTVQHSKICAIIKSIEQYLRLGLEEPADTRYNAEELKTLRSYWRNHGYIYEPQEEMDRLFTSSLHYAGWSWKEVYKLRGQK